MKITCEEVMELRKKGYTMKEIAKKLGASPSTVMSRVRQYEARFLTERGNKYYIIARDALIPMAKKYADGKYNPIENPDKWDRAFMLRMDHLSYEAGLTSVKPEAIE